MSRQVTVAALRSPRATEIGPPLHTMQVVYDLSAGGSELLACAIAVAGSARGVRMSVCGLGSSQALAPRLHASNVVTYSMARRPGLQPWLIARLYRLFRRERVTTIVTHHLGQLLYAGIAARLAGTRLLHVEHEFYTLQPVKEQRLLRAIAPLARRVVAVSDEIADFLVERVRLPRARVVVIPNGVDTERFAPRAADGPDDVAGLSGAPVIGTVGRLDPAKDHVTMLQAFCAVRAAVPSARLVIVGDGACRPQLEAFISEHGLGDSVRLLGERSDIPEVLSRLDVFALSSINEGLPLALLEAMACAKPVVTTDVGAAGAVVRRASAGIVVPPRDVDALAAGMLCLVRDLPRARRLGAAGRAVVERQYDLAATVTAYLALCGVGEA
jgi:glycosyltransferase involved in cell wall biosynthesis